MAWTLSIITMDNYPIVLGMDFLDSVKVVSIPLTNTMCILGEGDMNMAPLARKTNMQVKQLLTMQLHKGVKKPHPTYISILKDESKNDLEMCLVRSNTFLRSSRV